jgi:hypothetical protein
VALLSVEQVCTGDGSTDAMHRCTVEFYLTFSFLLASIAIRCFTVVRVHEIETDMDACVCDGGMKLQLYMKTLFTSTTG